MGFGCFAPALELALGAGAADALVDGTAVAVAGVVGADVGKEPIISARAGSSCGGFIGTPGGASGVPDPPHAAQKPIMPNTANVEDRSVVKMAPRKRVRVGMGRTVAHFLGRLFGCLEIGVM